MSDLWIPGSAEAKERPFVCRMCRDRFGDQRALIAHVEGCWDEHAEELLAKSPRRRTFDQMPDPEWHQYNRDLERRGIDPMRQYDRSLRSGVRKLRES